MSNPWELLHHQLLRSLATKSVARLFAELQRRHIHLAPFSNSDALLDFMASHHRGAVDLDRKDEIARALVLAAQERDSAACVAEILLELALWPLLCGVFRRSFRASADPDEVASTVMDAFTEVIHSLELDEARRVISTLIHNTHRRLVVLRKATARRASHEISFESMGAIPAAPCHEIDSIELLLSIENLLDDNDSDLIVLISIFGFTAPELAEAAGVPLGTMHKRIQRARLRFEQRVHETLQTGCPLFPRSGAIRE